MGVMVAVGSVARFTGPLWGNCRLIHTAVCVCTSLSLIYILIPVLYQGTWGLCEQDYPSCVFFVHHVLECQIYKGVYLGACEMAYPIKGHASK